MAIGTWTAYTQGSDPSGTATIDSGSNRKFVVARVGEFSSVPTSTVTCGGQSPTQLLLFSQGSANPYLFIEVAIWNESAIGSMSGSSVSWLDSVVVGNQSGGYVTVTDVDQSNLTTSEYDDAGTASNIFVSPSVSSSASDVLIGIGADVSANRGPITADGLTQRIEYSVSQYSAAILDGVGGGDLSAGATIENDGNSSSQMLGALVKFSPAAAGDPSITEISQVSLVHGANIEITGSDFGSTQGSGSVVIAPTDDVDDVNAVTQTVSAWQDDEISITIVVDTLNLDDTLYLFVENDNGDSNANGFPLVLEPNYTLNFHQPIFLKFTATITR